MHKTLRRKIRIIVLLILYILAKCARSFLYDHTIRVNFSTVREK